MVQAQLNQNTLKDCSKALVINPELEIWLWQDQTAIASEFGVKEKKLMQWLTDWQQKQHRALTVQELLRQFPKEAFEAVCRQAREKPRAALYERIASRANPDLWSGESSFRQMRRTLRRWFPPSSDAP
jgi:uncharacterized protein (DUF924 family)